MFDFDAGKLLIIGMVALIVIGPKDLPRVLRQVGQTVGKLRRMASEFQGQFMDAMKEADLQDIRDELHKVNQEAAKLTSGFDPVHDVRSELTQAVAPLGPVASGLPELSGSETHASEVLASETPSEGFVLPHLPEPVPADREEPAEISATLASAGLAPVAEEPALVAGESEGATAPKRKILLPKRRPPAPMRFGVLRPDAGRFRNVRPRRHEAVEP